MNWLRFDAANLKFYGTPTTNDIGNYTAKLTYNNGIKENFDTFNLVIANTGPSLISGNKL
jgi:hypothetical protein